MSDTFDSSRQAEERAKINGDQIRFVVAHRLLLHEYTDPDLVRSIQARYTASPESIRSRRAELVKLGLVEACGRRKHHTVHRLSPAGREYVEQGMLTEEWLTRKWRSHRDNVTKLPSAPDMLRDICDAYAGNTLESADRLDRLILQARRILG